MSRKLIEAALFMSSRPMSAEEIAKITGVPQGSAEKMLEGLRKEYDSEGKGVEIVRSPEGWEMRVRPEILPKVAHLTPYSDLKDGHKRTLALVAYKEPLKQSEIVRIQGNKAYNYVKFLRKKGLIKAEKEGRTVKLSLTKEFERYFGLEKERIKEMLQKGLDRAKEKEEVKAREAAKERGTDAKAVSRAEIKPEIKAESRTPVTPLISVQKAKEITFKKSEAKPAFEKKPTIQAAKETKTETKAAARPEIKPGMGVKIKPKPTRRKSKKLPPAAKIGTRRPGD